MPPASANQSPASLVALLLLLLAGCGGKPVVFMYDLQVLQTTATTQFSMLPSRV
jgi:uncharacterized lipoprotein YmbA